MGQAKQRGTYLDRKAAPNGRNVRAEPLPFGAYRLDLMTPAQEQHLIGKTPRRVAPDRVHP